MQAVTQGDLLYGKESFVVAYAGFQISHATEAWSASLDLTVLGCTVPNHTPTHVSLCALIQRAMSEREQIKTALNLNDNRVERKDEGWTDAIQQIVTQLSFFHFTQHSTLSQGFMPLTNTYAHHLEKKKNSDEGTGQSENSNRGQSLRVRATGDTSSQPRLFGY